MVEIAKCRMCGYNGGEVVRALGTQARVRCDCGASGPRCQTEELAITAWEELMAPTSAPAAGTVRVPVQVAYAASSMGSWPFVLANDGTMWGMPDGMSGKGVWQLLPPLPQPVEIPGTVENGE